VRFGGRAGDRRPPLAPDAELVRTLAALLTETGLSEIEYAVGDHRIRVARGTVTAAAGPTETVVIAPAAATAPPHPAAALQPVTNGHAPTPEHPGTVKSPLVGVAYLAPEPGASPFARIGESVTEGQTLLIIEAMKVMNQIRAPRAGKLLQVCVEDAEPVEYGAALMVIE
jgi:acetyl-CoA carboxylase biotin carboxyl carrier protein